ncbi:MAG TPA: alpha/beta fold hydrolase [Novimethylophilus sp.]|jgi:phospholipase/carboxylesterase|uniref:alpha/beta hydrolase n=1 Tax=Novimethylophilus sp. TaxID=2137426 RepID=UPI002F41B54B
MEKSAMLDAIEICSGASPEASVIWLHGLGADGGDFAPMAEELALPMVVRFIFPHAPGMPVTVNNGWVMPAWYDIYSLDIAGAQDETGIRASQAGIEALIAREKTRGVDSAHIVLAGFSQGGAVALQTALRHKDRLGGVVALSTYLPLHDSLQAESSEANRTLPIFMAHGRDDTVIPLEAARKSRRRLEAEGYPVEWHEYPMPHSVCGAEVDDIREFLLRILS